MEFFSGKYSTGTVQRKSFQGGTVQPENFDRSTVQIQYRGQKVGTVQTMRITHFWWKKYTHNTFFGEKALFFY